MPNDKTRLFIALAVIVMAFCLVLLLVATISLFANDTVNEAEANGVDETGPSANHLSLVLDVVTVAPGYIFGVG